MKNPLPTLLLSLAFLTQSWQAMATDSKMTMKINLKFNGTHTATATLENNEAAKDFYALLPLTLDVRDFAGTEKASGALPKKLSSKGAPKGYKPQAGDLTYYAPWGNLAAFYDGDAYANSLIFLGVIDNKTHLTHLKNATQIEITKD